MKNLITKIVGKTSGRQFKFYLDMMYGILKSKSIVLNDIAHSLNEETTLKKINERLYKNLMRIPEVTERHNLIKVGLTLMREKEKVFVIDDTYVIKPYGKAFEGMTKVRDASYYGSGINTTLGSNKNGVKNYKPIRDSKPKQLSLFKIYDFI